MLFPTITFAIFFLVVLPVSWLLMPRRRRWKIFMIAASYFFYGYGVTTSNWSYCLLIAGSTIGNQLIALRIFAAKSERAKRWWLIAGVAGGLGALGYFKYYANFLVPETTNFLEHLGIHLSPGVVSVTLPIGISFFTFQGISYLVDIYRGTFEPVKLLDFGVFLSFFPHVVAGPIVRPAEFLPQLKEEHDPRKIDASRALFLIFTGLFKKVVIADTLRIMVDPVFSSPKQHSGFTVLIAIYAFAIQIYADFSGYTDMAIGLALLLGFRFPQNFDSPYAAVTVQDFWRRWHMTLSRWLRDYLYIPLGGNRKGGLRTYRNLMITMLLGGLWHGAAWTFVVWGGIHGAFLALEHWRRTRRVALGLPDPPDTLVRRIGARIVTFHIVCLAWVFFRAESFGNAWDVLGRLFDPSHWFHHSPLVTGGVIAAILFGLIEQYIPKQTVASAMAAFSRLAPVAQGLVIGLALFLTDTLGPAGVANFIYFRF